MFNQNVPKLLSSATLIRLGLGFSLSDKTEPHENCRTFKHIGCNFHPNSVHDYYQLEDRYKTIDWAVVIGPGHISDDTSHIPHPSIHMLWMTKTNR